MRKEVILITGAAGLIGQSLVIGLKKENYKLVLIDNNEEKMSDLRLRINSDNLLFIDRDILCKNTIDSCIEEAHEIAEEIGYPVIINATACLLYTSPRPRYS